MADRIDIRSLFGYSRYYKDPEDGAYERILDRFNMLLPEDLKLESLDLPNTYQIDFKVVKTFVKDGVDIEVTLFPARVRNGLLSYSLSVKGLSTDVEHYTCLDVSYRYSYIDLGLFIADILDYQKAADSYPELSEIESILQAETNYKVDLSRILDLAGRNVSQKLYLSLLCPETGIKVDHSTLASQAKKPQAIAKRFALRKLEDRLKDKLELKRHADLRAVEQEKTLAFFHELESLVEGARDRITTIQPYSQTEVVVSLRIGREELEDLLKRLKTDT